MTYTASKFTDGKGKFFNVREVIQTPAGLTVYYENKDTKEQYSCLLDAFSERFRAIDQ